jgi:hypothetical protein
MRSVGCVCGEVLAAACHLQGICLFLFGGKVAKLSLNQRASKEYKQNEYKKLKQDNVDCIDAGAGVSEPGLNRRPDNMIA